MFELADWQRKAAELSYPYQAVIDGKLRAAQSGQTFAAINPATGQLLANVAACGEEDVDAAVQNARQVFEAGTWAGRSPTERKQVLLRLADLILANREELALLDSLNMGKPVMDAYNIDVPGAAGVFRWYAESLDKLYDQVAPSASSVLATITREALGVVAAVVPWNFPLDMAAWKLAPALAAGNSVILKPAEQSPFSALRLAELALEAGLPAGVLNVLPGLGEQTGKALGLHRMSIVWCSPARPRSANISCSTPRSRTSSRCGWSAAARAPIWCSPIARIWIWRRRKPRSGSSSIRVKSARPIRGCWWSARFMMSSSSG